MNRLVVAILLLSLVGCGPSKLDIATSQVNVVARKEFNEQNFQDGGKTGELDPWGHEITWVMSKGLWDYNLEVRSNGPDGLPYTKDDIVVNVSLHIPRSGEKNAEALLRGLSRGLVRGAKEGLLGEEKEKK
jgi:hypothetical protein